MYLKETIPVVLGFLTSILVGISLKSASDQKTVHREELESASPSTRKLQTNQMFEIWGSDQSNSVVGETSAGVRGSFLWIWDSDSILEDFEDASPLSCTPDSAIGPCDILDIFPGTLMEYDESGPTGNILNDLDGFGRLHGVLKDTTERYVAANIFTPGGGYVGVMDTMTKEAIGLFRVTATNANESERSVHMSFWSKDDSSIIVANLHGKALERIDVMRGENGVITGLTLNKSAMLYLGKNFNVQTEATYFLGNNAFGNPLIGSVSGTYDDSNSGDLTPTGACKEDGCTSPTMPTIGGGRPNNLPICPIPSSNNNVYITLAGGGLLVAKHDETPMKIVGEYGNAQVNGAGCGGVQTGNNMFLNSGVSASSAGATHSMFGLYAFDDTLYSTDLIPMQNYPSPMQVFKDPTNTNTLGNVDGTTTANDSGQKPNMTTRRDSHGMASTLDGKFVHVVDRIQNVMEVYDSNSYKHVGTYDLVSLDGKSGRGGPAGPCHTQSVIDDASMIVNDPAPDLMDITPGGAYFVIAFRGPKPVSVSHAAQGSCPGVGIVKITEGGKSGRLIAVLRATNTIDTAPVGTILGGFNYTGAERSDVHHALTIDKNMW